MEEFLKELPTVIKRAEPNLTTLLGSGPPLARLLKLRELQTSFVYSTVLAKKNKVSTVTSICLPTKPTACICADVATAMLKGMFSVQDLFCSYFDTSISGPGAADPSSPFCAAWLLFVTAKSKLLPPFPDLVASFNLLICVLNVAITHIPAAHRNVDLQDHSLFPVRTEDGGADTLQSLCLVNKANLPAVRALMHGMDNMLTGAAQSVPPSTSGLSLPPPNMATSCTFHPGFMSDPAVTAAVAASLDADYQQACEKTIDVDERPFLGRAQEAPPTPGPAAAPPSLARCLVGSPQRQAHIAHMHAADAYSRFSLAHAATDLLDTELMP